MVSPEEIDAAVAKVYSDLLAQHPATGGAVRKYTQRGGEGSWVTYGLLSHITRDDRLVLEVLWHKKLQGCVVRVYNEEPLNFHFARKTDNASACEALVREALRTFQLRLPPTLLAANQFAPPADLAHIEHVLMPVPPPLSACKVSD